MCSFNCKKCGSTNLGHQQWVESVSPVVIDSDGHLEYKQAIIDETNELGGVSGFICIDCKDPLCLHGCRVETEEELIAYLNLTPEEQSELENADLDNLAGPAEEGEIIFPKELDNVISAGQWKAYRDCAYSEEQYDTNEKVMRHVDSWVNEFRMPSTLAWYLHDNGYHEDPEVVKANLSYVNNAMKKEGYTEWADITPEQIQAKINQLKND